MTTGHYRDTWAEVEVGAIRHNAALAKGLLRGECRLMAIVKADGYGHGSVEAARAALAGGATYLGVALLDEALELRRAGFVCPILVLGLTAERAVEESVRQGITMTVCNERTLDWIADCCERHDLRACVHLKIDTGMTRLGAASADEAYRLASKAEAAGKIRLEGIYTHFAEADGGDDFFTRLQFRRFLDIVEELEARGARFDIRHCCNSAAAVRYPEMHLDMIRFGIGLYGLLPSDMTRGIGLGFVQAMSLKSRIVHLSKVPGGTTVGYGRTYRTERESLIATIPIGYADGYSRSLSGAGQALLRNERVSVAGNVCMDQLMLDASRVEGVRVDDTVTLFGREGDKELLIEEVAKRMGSISYEVVTKVAARVPRVYVE